MAKKFGKWIFTEEELDRRFKEASRLGEEEMRREPRAKRAYYDGTHRVLALEMLNGSFIARPVIQIQGLSNASPEEIARVTLTEDGDILQWDNLELDLSVAGLVEGILGSRSWMAELGRKGGSVLSEAKAVAARENGRLGGRPPLKKAVVVSSALSVQTLSSENELMVIKVSGGAHQRIEDLAKYEVGLINACRSIGSAVAATVTGLVRMKRTPDYAEPSIPSIPDLILPGPISCAFPQWT